MENINFLYKWYFDVFKTWHPASLWPIYSLDHRKYQQGNTKRVNIPLRIHKCLLFCLNSEKHPDKEHPHKFVYYSAHDTTVGALLVALNKGNDLKMDYHWPPFAANLIIELWKNEENKSEPNYYIKVLYMEQVGVPLLRKNTWFWIWFYSSRYFWVNASIKAVQTSRNVIWRILWNYLKLHTLMR